MEHTEYDNHPGASGSGCFNRIVVTRRASGLSMNGYACGLSGGHCVPREGCGFTDTPPHAIEGDMDGSEISGWGGQDEI